MDPFALLSAGLHYNAKFIPKNPNKQHQSSVALPLPELPQYSSQHPSKKKRKRAAQAGGGDDQTAAGISLFASSTKQQQQQYNQQQHDQLPEVHTNDPLEEANIIRKALRIKVKGSDIPAPIKHWSDVAKHPADEDADQQHHHKQISKKQKRDPLTSKHDQPTLLSRKLMQHLAENGWDTPTPIQRQAVPALLGGRDLLGIAPTGSGKTLAFVLPALALLCEQKQLGGQEHWPCAPKALLLSPTHELAAQTARVLKLLLPGSGLRCCLLNKSSATGSDFSKVDVLVANPLRLKGLVEDNKIDLSKVVYLVLDEADKLLAMGFTSQVDAVLAAATNPHICRAFFSATLPEKVEALARSVLRDPLHIVVGERNSAQSLVSQRLMFVGREGGKLLALRQLLKGGGLKPPILVFVSTKARAQQLHKELMYDGVHVDSISGDQPSVVRAAAVDNFRAGKTWVLIATDLLGRGMDFAGVNTVINYDFPQTTADYIHRVGRTGRAGHAGEAITFFTENDAPRLRSVARLAAEAGSEVPEWMLHMQKQKKKKKQAGKPPRAATPSKPKDGRMHTDKTGSASAAKGLKVNRAAKEKTRKGKSASKRGH